MDAGLEGHVCWKAVLGRIAVSSLFVSARMPDEVQPEQELAMRRGRQRSECLRMVLKLTLNPSLQTTRLLTDNVQASQEVMGLTMGARHSWLRNFTQCIVIMGQTYPIY